MVEKLFKSICVDRMEAKRLLYTYLGHFNLKILLNLFNLKSLSYQN